MENADYLSNQLITCIGNKRALLQFIQSGLERIQGSLAKRKLCIFDVFSGSGVVSRFFKQYSDTLIVNDIERYAEIINTCYLTNKSAIDLPRLRDYYNNLMYTLEIEPFSPGIISELYAPKDDASIKPDERVFYTTRNANYIDTARQYIDTLPKEYQHYFIAPLLSEASIHANTSGVFKGFYKNKKTGLGQYGGSNQNALERIMSDISLPFPVFSDFECEVKVFRGDAFEIACSPGTEVDIAYCDPPYNQHPYGSNYFMLNVIADYNMPENISRVSGIPQDWIRSEYNKKQKVKKALERLFSAVKAKYLLVSYNSEGYVSYREMKSLLEGIGEVTLLETSYNAFRGSRNLRGRSIHVKEYLFLVKKK
ncbi:MAG: DNA adenine methylase [Spirochaetales bacterium]|nr:DNA adenine methylase [Spirochaetales bacterium]